MPDHSKMSKQKAKAAPGTGEWMKRSNQCCPNVCTKERFSEEQITENYLLKEIDDSLRVCVADILKNDAKLEKI